MHHWVYSCARQHTLQHSSTTACLKPCKPCNLHVSLLCITHNKLGMTNSQSLGQQQMQLYVPGQLTVMEPVVYQLRHSASQICCIPAPSSERCTAPPCQDEPPMHSVAHLDPAFQPCKCVLYICMWCKLLTYMLNMQSTHRMRLTQQHTIAQCVI